jgi:DNA modification methylase
MKKFYELHKGDSKLIIPQLIEQGIEVDSIVTDPPYELGFMGKEWDKTGIANDIEFWKLCYQVLKPGGYLLAFSSTRTYHRMTCAIEDAGFEIRDQIGWLYGSGFPKSHNISKAIDKKLGCERKVLDVKINKSGGMANVMKSNKKHGYRPNDYYEDKGNIIEITESASEEAKQWDGWGSALKPAWEPICVARKPLSENTLAENVLKHKTGGINIDACRVPTEEEIINHSRSSESAVSKGKYSDSKAQDTHQTSGQKLGRFPANIIHDGSDEVLEEFAKYGERTSGRMTPEHKINESENRAMSGKNYARKSTKTFDSSTGSAARFFYSAKASSNDRAGSNHTTVKPLSLMSHLCKLVTPPEGKILDPFAGSGTTGQSAVENGFYPILIEKEPQYQKDIENRMSKFTKDTYYTLFE